MRLLSVLVLLSAFAITVLVWLPPAQAGEELARWEPVESSSDSLPAKLTAMPSYRIATDEAGSAIATDMSRFGAAEPLALAAGDFDEDGVPDLISGYGIAKGGVVVLRRGNVDALFPNAPAALERRARGGFQSAPFLADVKSEELAIAPELLGSGDFDADGHVDLVAGARGENSLYWLRGDGKGGFSASRRVPLAGPLTALAVGEVNRRDGLNDIVIATGGPSPQLAVFEGPLGALTSPPETLPLDGEALDVALGALDADSPRDIAVLIAREVVIVKGRDRKLTLGGEQRSKVPHAEITRHALGFDGLAISAGDFAGKATAILGILAADGALYALNQSLPDPLTLISAASETTSFGVAEAAVPGPRSRLLRAHTSVRSGDDLLVVTKGAPKLGLVTGHAFSNAAAGAPRTLSLPAEAVAVLPMRLNADTLSDFVILTDDPDQPLQFAATAATTFVVNSASCDEDANFSTFSDIEPPDGICATDSGACTFHAAVYECKGISGGCNFQFNIPDTGVPHVCYTKSLEIIRGVLPKGLYDGTTQSGGFVRLDGDLGFTDNVTLRGLYFAGAGMGGYGVVEGCRIGFDDDNTVSGGGKLTIGGDSQIGGTTPTARNLITGLWITGDNVVVEGNHFGFNEQGTTAYAAGIQSVLVRTYNWGQVGPKDVTIGGLVAGARNLFAGHVDIDPGTSGVLFQGNYLGADATGSVAVYPSGSVFPGMTISGTNHTIGGPSAAARNLIVAAGSSTPGTAIRLGHEALAVLTNPNMATSNVLIQGNYIGTDDTGTAKLGSWGYGVKVTGSANGIHIGGTTTDAGNVISGSAYAGVALDETTVNTTKKSTHDNVIQGNMIGADKNGTAAIPNRWGIAIKNSWDNLIGGTQAGARNVISGNSEAGILIWSGYADAKRNTIQGNYIGVDSTGLVKLANANWGIYADGADNIIGGLTAAARNVVAGNGGIGIHVMGSNQTVQGNYVGVGADGTTPIGNNIGIQVDGTGSTIGGTTASARNVVAANNSGGMVIPGSNHTVQGNYVGVAANGTTPRGNRYGIRITGSNNEIGGEAAGAPNVIANSSEQGVIVAGGSGNSILRNSIYANSMGIDLGNNGVTANDPLDVDDGPNGLQNAPVLTSIETASGYTVNGNLHSAPSKLYKLEFYANCALDSGNQGEGKSFLGALNVATSSMGDVLFSTTFPAPSCPIITATATDPDGNTSEFSMWIESSVTLTTTVSPPGSGTVTPDCSAGCTYNIGQSVTLTPTPALNRTFNSWSGDVTSLNAPLTITMNGSKNITANFEATPVTGTMRIAGSPPAYFSSVTQAFAAADNNDVIQMQAASYGGPLTFDNTGVSVTLKGGYNATYSDNTGQTFLGSPFTFKQGTVIVDSIAIQ